MKLYRVLAYLVAAEVAVQAALITFGMFGLGHWVYDEGHTATRSTFEEGGPHYTGDAGFNLHGENGALYIPLLALVFLAVAIATRRSLDGGLRWAAIVVGLVALQVVLGFLSLQLYWLGPLHGVNALAIFWSAIHAARRPVARTQVVPSPADATPAEAAS
jgi:heme A synthase